MHAFDSTLCDIMVVARTIAQCTVINLKFLRSAAYGQRRCTPHIRFRNERVSSVTCAVVVQPKSCFTINSYTGVASCARVRLVRDARPWATFESTNRPIRKISNSPGLEQNKNEKKPADNNDETYALRFIGLAAFRAGERSQYNVLRARQHNNK